MKIFSTKPQPKQDHPRDFDAAEEGPYACCNDCWAWLEIMSEGDIEVFYDKARGHRHLFQRGDIAESLLPPPDPRLIITIRR